MRSLLQPSFSPSSGSKKVPIVLALAGILLHMEPHLQGEILGLVEDFSFKACFHMIFHNPRQIGSMVLMFYSGRTFVQASKATND